jgi:3-dehydro-4-phosphotetronate decarboxylase
MSADEGELRRSLVEAARHLSARGLSPGSSGNLSLRLDDTRLLVTPTGIGLHAVEPGDLAVVALSDSGDHEPTSSGGDAPRPSKEVPLHRATYESRPRCVAVVHLHAPHSAALSCLPDQAWPGGRLPFLTPYQVLKVGELGRAPYAPPGSPELAAHVGVAAARHRCLLMANHGSLATGTSLSAAVEAAEEMEAAARMLVTLRGLPYQALEDAAVRELRAGE